MVVTWVGVAGLVGYYACTRHRCIVPQGISLMLPSIPECSVVPAGFMYLVIFDVDVLKTWAGFASLFIGLSFVFGNSIRTTCEGHAPPPPLLLLLLLLCTPAPVALQHCPACIAASC